MNNCIPESMTPEDKLESINPLKVITKTEWLGWKLKMKEISKVLAKNKKFPLSEEKASLKTGTILKLIDLPEEHPQVTKWDIKVAIKHYCEPAYVDYVAGNKEAFVRFFNKPQLKTFLEELKERKLMIKGFCVDHEIMPKGDEIAYFNKVEFKRKKLSEKLQKKRKVK